GVEQLVRLGQGQLGLEKLLAHLGRYRNLAKPVAIVDFWIGIGVELAGRQTLVHGGAFVSDRSWVGNGFAFGGGHERLSSIQSSPDAGILSRRTVGADVLSSG